MLLAATTAWAPTVPASTGAQNSTVEGLVVDGSGTCPARRDVEEALADLIPPGQEGAFRGGVEIRLREDGDTYRVWVSAPEKQAEKVYTDPARDCHERARVAAVFVFLTVFPPELWGDALEGSTLEGSALEREDTSGDSKDEPDVTVPEEGSTVPALFRFELGGFAETAPALGKGPAMASGGVELRSVVGRGSVAALLAVGYAPSIDLVAPGLEARLWRAPLSVGARWRLPYEAVWIGLDGGLHGQLQGISATSPVAANRDVLVRWGARFAFSVGGTSSPLFPFASLHVTVLGDRRELVVLPRGTVAELPRVWLGATIGAGLEL